MWSRVREWLSKWWTYLLLGAGFVVLLLRGRRSTYEQPAPVDITKVVAKTEAELAAADDAHVKELEALDKKRADELNGAVDGMDARTPGLLEDSEALNRYLLDTGKDVRK